MAEKTKKHNNHANGNGYHPGNGRQSGNGYRAGNGVLSAVPLRLGKNCKY